MGKIFKAYLNTTDIYRCLQCDSHLTSESELESKTFRSGPHAAFLFKTCINITMGPSQDRELTTGLHKVCDLYCLECECELGWTYLQAFEQSQKYKEGKYILVETKIYKNNEKKQTQQRLSNRETERDREREREQYAFVYRAPSNRHLLQSQILLPAILSYQAHLQEQHRQQQVQQQQLSSTQSQSTQSNESKQNTGSSSSAATEEENFDYATAAAARFLDPNYLDLAMNAAAEAEDDEAEQASSGAANNNEENEENSRESQHYQQVEEEEEDEDDDDDDDDNNNDSNTNNEDEQQQHDPERTHHSRSNRSGAQSSNEPLSATQIESQSHSHSYSQSLQPVLRTVDDSDSDSSDDNDNNNSSSSATFQSHNINYHITSGHQPRSASARARVSHNRR
jgi:hypothetical protein